jgi:hypothetical protein
MITERTLKKSNNISKENDSTNTVSVKKINVVEATNNKSWNQED